MNILDKNIVKLTFTVSKMFIYFSYDFFKVMVWKTNFDKVDYEEGE